MKLKYYLRGIGIGVIITTLIFMISISIHKDDKTDTLTENSEQVGKTVAQANGTEMNSSEMINSEMNSSEMAETEPTEVPISTETEEVPPVDNTEFSVANTEQVSSEDGTTPQTPEAPPQIVPFTVGKGEYSDLIAAKLAELKLVDNAEAFNKFLIEKNYDNFILPGTYSIPMDSTYEEIAALLTTKAVPVD